MGFIHSRNVCEKEVITFSSLWEENSQEEEARLIRREEKMEANEDQALKEDPSSNEEYEELNS